MRAALEAAKAMETCEPDDRWFYADKIRNRIAALEMDEPMFGLVPAEVAELQVLKLFLEKQGIDHG